MRCQPRQRLLRALDVLLLQGFRRLRRGYVITRTSHWKDCMQDLTAYDVLEHANEGWQALDMGCDLSRTFSEEHGLLRTQRLSFGQYETADVLHVVQQ